MANRPRGEGVQNRLVGWTRWWWEWGERFRAHFLCGSSDGNIIILPRIYVRAKGRGGGCHQWEAERLSGLIPSSCCICTIAAHNSPAVCKLQFHSMAMWWWWWGGSRPSLIPPNKDNKVITGLLWVLAGGELRPAPAQTQSQHLMPTGNQELNIAATLVWHLLLDETQPVCFSLPHVWQQQLLDNRWLCSSVGTETHLSVLLINSNFTLSSSIYVSGFFQKKNKTKTSSAREILWINLFHLQL